MSLRAFSPPFRILVETSKLIAGRTECTLFFVLFNHFTHRFFGRTKKKFKSYHYIKDSRWKYENEWRIVVSKEIINGDLMYFDREQLKSITFGFNVEKDLKEKTIQLIDSLNYKVDFFQIIKTNSSYELTTEKCPQQ